MDKILNYFGTDKILHFLVGAVISFIITNICIIQDGVLNTSCITFGVIGLVVAIVAGLMKELIVDSTFDWKDLTATTIGGVLPILVNAIGVAFNVLSN